MGDYEMELAQKELGRWFTSKRTKQANAAGHYLSAANKYKTAKQHKKSARAFEMHAQALENLGDSMFRICDSYKNAAVQLKLAKDPACMDMYDRAVNVLCDQGKHSQAAKMCKEMGELAATAKEYEDALMHYEKAMDLYQADDYKVQARRCLEQLAELHVRKDPPDFSNSADLFEQLGKESLQTKLTRSRARQFFFKAAICVIAAGDAVLAREKGDLFLRLDPSLGTGREGKLMQTLIKALEDFDVTTYSQSVRDYNDIYEFDPWHVKVLLAGRSHIDPDMGGDVEASAVAAASPAKKSTNAGAYSGGGKAPLSSDASAGASATTTSTSVPVTTAIAVPSEGAKEPLQTPATEPVNTGDAPSLPPPSAGASAEPELYGDDDDDENFFG